MEEAIKTHIAQLEQMRKHPAAELADAEKRVDENAAEIAVAKRQIDGMKERLSELEKMRGELQKVAAGFRAELHVIQIQINALGKP